MFRIKLCGITNSEDARLAVEAGADAIGLNFFQGSPRAVDFDRAQAIAAAVGNRIATVGVFVNASSGSIRDMHAALTLDAVQLHGDEPPELLMELAGLTVIRAFRLDGRGLEPVHDYLNCCGKLNCTPHAVLLDACVKGSFGGTGMTVDWSVAGKYGQFEGAPPLILAGGLTPDNVAHAIRAAQPAAVDVASGVEQSAGRKSEILMRRFVQEALAEFIKSDGQN